MVFGDVDEVVDGLWCEFYGVGWFGEVGDV